MSYSVEYIYRLRDRMTPALNNIRKNSAKTAKRIRGSFKSVETSLRSTGKRMRDVGAGMTAAGAGIGAGLGLMVKQASDFNKGVAELSTLMSAKPLEQVKKEFGPMMLDMAKEFGEKTETITKSAYQAVSAGIEPSRSAVKEFLAVAGDAAAGGVTDIETSVNALTSVVNAYGPEMVSAKKASDLIFSAVKDGKTTFEEMGSSLYNVIPVAAAVGVKFEDVTAAIATMTKQGTPTKQATTQIRQAIAELTKGSTEVAKWFKTLSGKSFPDFIKSGGSLQGALQILEKGTKKTGESMVDVFSSIEAGQAALSLTGDSAKTYSKSLDAARKSAGATGQAAKKMKKSADFRFKQAIASIKVLSIQLGNVLLPAFADISSIIANVMDSIVSFARENKGLTKVILVCAAALAAFLTVGGASLVVFGAMASGLANVMTVLPMLKTALFAVGGALKFMAVGFIKAGVAMMTTPIGWIIVGVAGVAAAIYLLYKNWDDVVNFIKFGAGWIADKMSNLGDTLSDVWTSVKNAAITAFCAIWDKVSSVFGKIKDAGKWISGILGGDSEKSVNIKEIATRTAEPGAATAMAGGIPRVLPVRNKVDVNVNKTGEVGGTLKIEIDNKGKGRVKEARGMNLGLQVTGE